jgi:peptide/nickel transport system permease protein
LQRLFHGVLVVFGVMLLMFLFVRLLPGDPGRLVLGTRASAEAVARLDRSLGLEDSLPAQYVNYMHGWLRGDLGESITLGEPVAGLIGERTLVSFVMVGYALLIALIVALPLGLFTALRANKPADHAVRLVSVCMYAIPSFWFGLMAALLFGLKLDWFPTSGYDPGFPTGLLHTLTLPALTLAIAVSPILIRLLRVSVITTLGSEFVEAARARGLGSQRIMRRHVLRNSLASTVTFVGASIGGLLSFSVVVEQVFNIPGLGSLLVTSVSQRDYPVTVAVGVVFAVTVVFANLIADLVLLLLDPRVRL